MSQELFEKRKKLICELLEDEMYVPLKEKELAAFMQVAKEDREEFRKVLDALLREGKVQVTAKGKYIKPDERLLTGTFISNAKGFGFVEIEGREEDLYVPEEMVNNAFHLDRVQVELLPGKRGKRQEAVVRKVLEHGARQIVGTYEQSASFGFVIPDNGKIGTDIFVPKERSKGAVDGHKVVVELTSYGDERHKPEGKIVEILGHINDPGVDILSIIRGYGLPEGFGEKVMNQAERVPDTVSDADMAGRTDLRDVQMVTIDGEDAKDLDDAVSLFKEGELYHLGVHIADVSNYVQENSALDWEALERGTSVYLVDRVIPMLPHKLSNGICSLNQGVDRLALSCLMTIDNKGNVTDYQIVESVIRVDRRMSYTSVKKILEDHDEQECREYESLIPMFEQMAELAALLREKRHKRGSIDFDFPETKILLDSEGHPVDIRP
ncbi:MAG: ribonuclease R, partial [Lachnospiraceae bacterium]|nr:ribonuclease R [Lachnospiraceae bacterium]